MAASIPALANPAVLRWARESIGLEPIAAARKLGLPDERVEQWENGEQRPTIAQLRKAVTVYNRALGVFFLPEPPTQFDTLRDFRRHVGAEAGAWSAALHIEYRRAHEQRDYLLELAELEERIPPAGWRVDVVPDDPDELAAVARDLLLAEAPLALPSSGDARQHLNAWTAAVEKTGVLVMTTRRGMVATREMRAFSLYFDDIPVIMLNGADSVRGRLFSLLHEFAHLLLHTAGLCDTTTDRKAVDEDRALEARCNAIAAAVLMPEVTVRQQPTVLGRTHSPTSWTYESLRQAAAGFGVSAEALLRRLVTLGLTTPEFYDAKRSEFLAAYDNEERQSRGDGGNFYATTARDLGKGYVREVADAHRRRVIDSATAATYLGVKVGQITRLAQAATIQAVS